MTSPHDAPESKLLLSASVLGIAWGIGVAPPAGSPDGKSYQIVNGKVDARTHNGFRRYHAGCNHCHGPDGTGSTFGPSLVDKLTDINAFRRIVREGQRNGTSIMKGFANDPNVSPYIDDIYGYLRGARRRRTRPRSANKARAVVR